MCAMRLIQNWKLMTEQDACMVLWCACFKVMILGPREFIVMSDGVLQVCKLSMFVQNCSVEPKYYAHALFTVLQLNLLMLWKYMCYAPMLILPNKAAFVLNGMASLRLWMQVTSVFEWAICAAHRDSCRCDVSQTGNSVACIQGSCTPLLHGVLAIIRYISGMPCRCPLHENICWVIDLCNWLHIFMCAL